MAGPQAIRFPRRNVERAAVIRALIAALASAEAEAEADGPVVDGEPMNVDLNAPDVLATDGLCSLREAIINANDDSATWPDCPVDARLREV